MQWLLDNAFLILVLLVCAGMHLFGHGHGHGGHRHGHDRGHEPNDNPERRK